MPRARRPDAFRISVFFECLPEAVAEEIEGPVGTAYDGVLYATSMPITSADVVRSLGFAGFEKESLKLPREAELRALLDEKPYPLLATLAPKDVASGAWSTILHFHDPSYSLDSPEARRGLAHLGYNITELDPYAIFVAAIDDLKDRAPARAVPETHWFLSRLIQVGLEHWGRGVVPRESKGSQMATRR